MQPLRILIGDDVFESASNRNSPIFCILLAMEDVFGRKPGPIKLKEGPDRTIICEKEIGPFSPIIFKWAPSSDVLIQDADDSYDWIVTDYNYGPSDPEGGLRVIDFIKGLSKPIKAVCTSADEESVIKQLQKKGVTYLVSTRLSGAVNKFELLGKQIAQHYLA